MDFHVYPRVSYRFSIETISRQYAFIRFSPIISLSPYYHFSRFSYIANIPSQTAIVNFHHAIQFCLYWLPFISVSSRASSISRARVNKSHLTTYSLPSSLPRTIHNQQLQHIHTLTLIVLIMNAYIHNIHMFQLYTYQLTDNMEIIYSQTKSSFLWKMCGRERKQNPWKQSFLFVRSVVLSLVADAYKPYLIQRTRGCMPQNKAKAKRKRIEMEAHSERKIDKILSRFSRVCAFFFRSRAFVALSIAFSPPFCSPSSTHDAHNYIIFYAY